MSVRVLFEAELYGVDCDRPEDDAALRQSVQNEIGHTGAMVTEVIEYEQERDDD